MIHLLSRSSIHTKKEVLLLIINGAYISFIYVSYKNYQQNRQKLGNIEKIKCFEKQSYQNNVSKKSCFPRVK